jgi:hypothetical protein
MAPIKEFSFMQKNGWIVACVAAIGLAAGLTGAGTAAHYRARAAEAERALGLAKEEAKAANARTARARTVTVETRAPAPAKDDGAALSEVAARDAQIAEMEKLLAQRDEQVKALELAAASRAASTNDARRDRGRAWMEQLRASNPQRAEEMAQRREEAFQQATTAFTDYMEKLKSRDTSTMSEEDRNAYSLLVQTLDETWQLGEQLRSADLPMEERMAVVDKLRTNMGELRPMMDAERTREFTRIGTELGYNADEAGAFAAHLNGVVDTTSMRSVFEGGLRSIMGGGRGRGGNRDGGGSRDAGGMAPP